MKRNVSLDEISDGRLYGSNDMVKADCHGCNGCWACCTGMGNSVILDPYDVYRMQQGLKKGFLLLMEEGKLELNVVDGVILPNLKMVGQEEKCIFLDEKGRCSIHESRPGICRLFPLGRYYEGGDFQYFLQTGECKAVNRSKVKISKWIDTPDQKRNHDFVCKWHALLNKLEETVIGCGRNSDSKEENGFQSSIDLETGKRLNMLLLKLFFLEPYNTEEDFYFQFETRMETFQEQFCC